MKRFVCLGFAILLLISCFCVTSCAEGNIQPAGLPDVFPRTANTINVKPCPVNCFNSYASENGLEGLNCYLVGKVTLYKDVTMESNELLHCFVLQTENGYALIEDLYSYMLDYKATTPELKAEVEEPGSDYTFPEIGAFVKTLCIYSGYSDVYQMPVFYFGAPKLLVANYSKENSNNQGQQNNSPTMGESNALKKAYQYLNVMAFSRSGLISQLEYDGFSTSEATYAVDNSNEDWNEQAVSKAAQYLSLMAFSRDRLIQQLEHDGFTHDQAVYGAQQNGY